MRAPPRPRPRHGARSSDFRGAAHTATARAQQRRRRRRRLQRGLLAAGPARLLPFVLRRPPVAAPPASASPVPPDPPSPAPFDDGDERVQAFQTMEVLPLLDVEHAPEPLAARRFTLFLVPDGGRGPLRQVELSLIQVRLALTAAAAVCLLALAGALSPLIALPATRSRDALLAENLTLRARMQDVERKLSDVDAQLQRLRLYNSQLDELPLSGIPGFGPLEADEVSNLIWLGRADAATWGAAGWEPGMPMEEPPGDEVAPAELTPAEAHALELAARADRLLEGVRLVEPGLGELVETAQEWRWRKETVPSLMPVPTGLYSSSFGWRRAPFSRRWKFHTGIDMAAPPGTPVYASGAGTVTLADWSGGYGRMVIIDHGEGIVSRYAHNNQVLVREGDSVARGQQIATVGMTGRTTGPHLHFEIYVDGVAVDPDPFLHPR